MEFSDDISITKIDPEQHKAESQKVTMWESFLLILCPAIVPKVRLSKEETCRLSPG